MFCPIKYYLIILKERTMFGNKFWMVYVDGTKGTHKTHFKKDLAEQEAKRLHAISGRTVYILELIKTIKE
jgi:hypothetical protein